MRLSAHESSHCSTTRRLKSMPEGVSEERCNRSWRQLVVEGTIRPSKVIAKAFNAGFVRREALLF